MQSPCRSPGAKGLVVQGFGFRVWGVKGLEIRIPGFRFGVQDKGLRFALVFGHCGGA